MNVFEKLKRPHPPWLQNVVLAVVVLLVLFGCDVNVHNVGSYEQPETGQDPVAAESGEPSDTPDDPVIDDDQGETSGLFRWQK